MHLLDNFLKFLLVVLGIVAGYGLIVGLGFAVKSDLRTEIVCVAALVFGCAYYLLTLPYRACRNRCKSLSKQFATTYKKALATEPTRFADLPVMPVWTPYDIETTVMSTSIPTNDVDAFLDAFVAEFYETTGGDVALTRGDNHKAATG
ncbi:MAG: hypothetical protein J6K20_12330, partial [Thermoguttaceae bacterium]|nr:hypothetical protein [Thermoguttaceae bacterium]